MPRRRCAAVAAFTLSLVAASALAQPSAPPARLRGTLYVSLADYMECAVENAFIRGESVLLTGGDFLPNEVVEVVLEQDSGDVPLAPARATVRGGLEVRIAIPANASTEGDVRLRVTAEKGLGGGGIVLRSPPLRIFADAKDADADGVQDRCDTCPAVASPNLEDSDRDGLGDACDTCPNDSSDDADKDGLCADVDPNPYEPSPPAEAPGK
jgi:hypothetical protein